MNKRISIGRDRSCDIFTSDQYSDVSRNHADIFLDGSRLILEDHSSNGTYINGQKINHTNREIRVGDNIQLGRNYTLSWNEVSRFFPGIPTGNETTRDFGRHTERYVVPTARHDDRYDYSYREENRQFPQRELEDFFGKWNWGGFFFHWIFSVCHKVYWPLIALVFPIAVPVIMIIAAMNGNKWAWNSRRWESLEECKRVQLQWRNWGLGIYTGLFVFFLLMISQY